VFYSLYTSPDFHGPVNSFPNSGRHPDLEPCPLPRLAVPGDREDLAGQKEAHARVLSRIPSRISFFFSPPVTTTGSRIPLPGTPGYPDGKKASQDFPPSFLYHLPQRFSHPTFNTPRSPLLPPPLHAGVQGAAATAPLQERQKHGTTGGHTTTRKTLRTPDGVRSHRGVLLLQRALSNGRR